MKEGLGREWREVEYWWRKEKVEKEEKENIDKGRKGREGREGKYGWRKEMA